MKRCGAMGSAPFLCNWDPPSTTLEITLIRFALCTVRFPFCTAGDGGGCGEMNAESVRKFQPRVALWQPLGSRML